MSDDQSHNPMPPGEGATDEEWKKSTWIMAALYFAVYSEEMAPEAYAALTENEKNPLCTNDHSTTSLAGIWTRKKRESSMRSFTWLIACALHVYRIVA